MRQFQHAVHQCERTHSHDWLCGLADHLWWSPRAGTRNQYAYPQLQLYQRCLDTFGGQHRHMAFIDSDEVRAAITFPNNSCCLPSRVQGCRVSSKRGILRWNSCSARALAWQRDCNSAALPVDRRAGRHEHRPLIAHANGGHRGHIMKLALTVDHAAM